MNLRTLRQHRSVSLAQLTMREWFADNTPRHAAALAYYTIFALSPLLTIVFSIAGALYGYDVARTNIVALVGYYVPNPGVAEMMQTVLTNSINTPSNPILTLITIGVLIYGATSVFSELQGALNLIWDAPVKNNVGLLDIFYSRLFAILMVFLGGLVLFAALLVSTVIATANQWAELHWHVTIYSEWLVFFSLLGISTLIFALIYKFVPDVEVAWHDVWIGAIATGLLFTIARTIINWSLRYGSTSSIFGATGSLVVFLVWVYYSALIFFLGAEFTQVYGRTYGSRWRELQLLAETTVEEKPGTIETEEGIIVKDSELSTTADAETPMIESTPLTEDSGVEGEESTAGDILPPKQTVPTSDTPKPSKGRIKALRERVHQNVGKVQQGAKTLSKIPRTITSPIGDIAIGVAVVGIISVTGFLLEPWRRKQKEEKQRRVGSK